MQVSNRNKEKIFKLILNEPNPFKENDRNGILDFLNSVWDLKSISLDDSQVQNTERDIIQHTINNDDWDLEYLFINKLKLYSNDKYFIKFIETVVNPKFRIDENEIERISKLSE